jgi:hypothetical protein
MKSLERLVANAIVLGFIVVLLAPAVVHALHSLALPIAGVVVIVVLVRVVWFHTRL